MRIYMFFICILDKLKTLQKDLQLMQANAFKFRRLLHYAVRKSA